MRLMTRRSANKQSAKLLSKEFRPICKRMKIISWHPSNVKPRWSGSMKGTVSVTQWCSCLKLRRLIYLAKSSSRLIWMRHSCIFLAFVWSQTHILAQGFPTLWLWKVELQLRSDTKNFCSPGLSGVRQQKATTLSKAHVSSSGKAVTLTLNSHSRAPRRNHGKWSMCARNPKPNVS